jgi:hypothetical protein
MRLIMTKSQNEKLVQFFSTGKSLTESEAQSRFGVARLPARVQELRAEGYSIYTNKTKNGTAYRLGNPTRVMVATAYAVMGSSAFA